MVRPVGRMRMFDISGGQSFGFRARSNINAGAGNCSYGGRSAERLRRASRVFAQPFF